MMKFLAFLLPSLALARVSSITKEMLNSIDHKKLLKNAIPVDNNMVPRKLEDTFQLSSAMSVQFNSCVSLSVEPSYQAQQVLYNQKYYNYASSGSFVTQKSYVLFNACETNYCTYAADDYNLFLVDLETYLQALLPYYATKKKNYCSACSASGYECYQKWYEESGAKQQEQEEEEDEEEEDEGENYPNYNSNGGYEYNPYASNNNNNGYYDENSYQQNYQNGNSQQEENQYGQAEQLNNDGQEQMNNGGDRKLYDNYNNYNGGQYNGGNNGNGYNNKEDYQDFYEVVECDTCMAMGCFGDADTSTGQYYSNSDEIDVMALAQWASNIGQCYSTGATWADVDLYAGFMCNDKGNGVEIGVFLDNECSLYTTLDSFSKVASEQDQWYMKNSQEVVTFPFTNAIDCSDKLSYRPVSYETINDSTTYASYPCQQLFQGNSLMLDDCNIETKTYQTAEDYYYGNYGNDNGNNQNSWYQYKLTQDEAQDLYGSCKAIKQLEGEYYQPLYQHDQSGESFDYGDVKPRYKPVADATQTTLLDDWETAAVVVIIFAVASVIGVSIWTYNSCCINELQKLSDKGSDDEQEEKGERFIVLEDGDGKVIL